PPGQGRASGFWFPLATASGGPHLRDFAAAFGGTARPCFRRRPFQEARAIAVPWIFSGARGPPAPAGCHSGPHTLSRPVSPSLAGALRRQPGRAGLGLLCALPCTPVKRPR